MSLNKLQQLELSINDGNIPSPSVASQRLDSLRKSGTAAKYSHHALLHWNMPFKCAFSAY